MASISKRYAVLMSGLGLTLAACAPSSLVDVAPTNAVADPTFVATAAGATQLYNYVMTRFAMTVAGTSSSTVRPGVVTAMGIFTDELLRVQGAIGDQNYDERIEFPNATFNNVAYPLYSNLHPTRVSARQAREALRAYAPDTPLAWQGRLQAMEGYAILLLGEIFCSGIPLSTVPLVSGSPVYTRGFTTTELFEHAIALLDSAIVLAGDSTRFSYLAKVGKGRALLDLGRFADAATAVADVPTSYVYVAQTGGGSYALNTIGNKPQSVQSLDAEGTNGLLWSLDPRTAIVMTPALSGAMKVPGKYSITAAGTIDATVAAPNTPVRVADGLEARLIEAEAALALNDPSWLSKLNSLRSTCVGSAACAPVPGLTAAALPPLADPGNANARLDLLMKERAMWLYLTGHRQGDLRRMAHVYQRDPLTLWPVGIYVNPGFAPLIQPAASNGAATYGTVMVVRTYIDNNVYDQSANPLYTGCADLNP